jgi:hypothetical protein
LDQLDILHRGSNPGGWLDRRAGRITFLRSRETGQILFSVDEIFCLADGVGFAGEPAK